MTFTQWRNRPTTHFSEHIPVVKRRISACSLCCPHRPWYPTSVLCGEPVDYLQGGKAAGAWR